MIIAKWEAKGGKRFVELHYDGLLNTAAGPMHNYHYKTDNGGGGLGPEINNHRDAMLAMTNPWGSKYVGQVTILKSDFPSTKRVI